MSDKTAPEHFVRDISPHLEGSAWRWTLKEPTLKFWLDDVEEQRFQSEFSFARETLAQTGPVRLSIAVNGHLLDTVHIGEEGARQYSKRVPSAWLKRKAENTVVMKVDKLWVSEADGGTRGFILVSAGFAP